jgi:hypothetical protein
MNKLTIAAATIVAGAMLASAPVQAEQSGGGPIHKGAQCFKHSQSMERDARFGIWTECPQTASVPANANAASQSRQIAHRQSGSSVSR